MASIVSNATGNWSAGSTWVGGVVPGNGDTATINPGHNVTVDTNTTIGTGGATGAVAVTIAASDIGGKLILGAVTFTVQGDLVIAGRATNSVLNVQRRLQLGPSSHYVFATGTGNDRRIKFDGSLGRLASMYAVGSSGSRCQFSQTGTGTGGFTFADLYTGYYTIDYCTFSGLTADPCFQGGDSLLGASAGLTSTADMDATIGRHVTFDGCGLVDLSNGVATTDMPISLGGTIKNSTSASGFALKFGAGVATAAVLKNLAVDAVAQINFGGVTTFRDCIFGEVISQVGGGLPSENLRNIYVTNTTSAGIQLVAMDSDFIDFIFWFRNSAARNPHWAAWGVTRDQLVQGGIFFQEANDNQGDCWIAGGPTTPAVSHTLTIKKTIRTRCASGNNAACGPFFSVNHSTSNAPLVYEHNTAYVDDGASGIYLGEAAGGDYAGECTSLKSNIHYNKAASASGYVIDADPLNSSADTNFVSAANADYNGRYGIRAGSRGNGYNFTGTGTPDAHGVSGDPSFVDDLRSPLRWAQTIDGSITTNDGVMTLLMTANDDAANASVATACQSILDYTRAGYQPTNSAYRGTAHDGTDIGAVAMASGTNVLTGFGSLSVTGFAPTVTVTVNVAPGVGAATVSGFAPTVVIPNNIATGKGAATIAGFSPTIVIGINLAPGVGAATLTGFAPTVAISNNQNIATSLGQLSASGFAPTVATPCNVLSGKGAVLLTGFAPIVAAATPPSIIVFAREVRHVTPSVRMRSGTRPPRMRHYD